jgi:hypothetical protein
MFHERGNRTGIETSNVRTPTHKGLDNIKMYLKEIGLSVKYCTVLVEGRHRWTALVYTLRNIQVPYNFGKF